MTNIHYISDGCRTGYNRSLSGIEIYYLRYEDEKSLIRNLKRMSEDKGIHSRPIIKEELLKDVSKETIEELKKYVDIVDEYKECEDPLKAGLKAEYEETTKELEGHVSTLKELIREERESESTKLYTYEDTKQFHTKAIIFGITSFAIGLVIGLSIKTTITITHVNSSI